MAALSSLIAGAPSVIAGDTDLGAATGDVGVTGVGFKPNWIVILGVVNSTPQASTVAHVAYKTSSSSNLIGSMIYKTFDSTNSAYTPTFINMASGSLLYNIYTTSGESLGGQAYGILKTFDADGFTITRQAGAAAVSLHWLVGR